MFGSDRDPYVDLNQNDFYREDDMIQVDLSEDSVTRRLMEYDQNDFMRYVAKKNPLGSEELFLEERGSRFGKSVYSAFDELLESFDEIYIFHDSRWEGTGDDPRQVACNVLNKLESDMDQIFYESAMNAVEEYAFEEGIRVESEI